MASRRRLLLSLISATTLATASLGMAAVASTAAAPSTSNPTGAACAAELAPLGPGQTASAVVSYRCFDTLAESVAFATKGAVQLPRAASTVEEGGEAPIQVAASSLLGIEYTGSSWTGATLALYGGGSGCASGASYGFASLPGGWNNVISSARSYSGCTSRHYDGTSYTGSSYLCGCGSMGTMNNRTSSILFS